MKLQQENAKMKKIINLLENAYPDSKCSLEHEDAFQLLVATILSAQCTDKRVNLVTKKLFKDYPTPDSLSKITTHKLEKIIFVTHPHKKHYLGGIIGKYKIDVGDLLIDVINKSQYKDKIIHLDFRKILFEKNIENIEKLFVQNDIFSHLTIEAYIKYYFPEILKII